MNTINHDINVSLNVYIPELLLNDGPYWELNAKADTDELNLHDGSTQRYWWPMGEGAEDVLQ